VDAAGQQAIVGMPGDNEKRELARSLHWRTGRLIETWGAAAERRTAGLICRHPDNLRRAFRHCKIIHVICDNAFNHRPDRNTFVRKHLDLPLDDAGRGSPERRSSSVPS
jgi:hypothetical protein